MKSILQWLLKILSKAILRKYHPKIIGITGSVGKSSAKEAIFAVLEKRFNVRRNVKNYNNELGVPLTILGCETGNKSLIKWLGIIIKGCELLLKRDKNYPEVLVLEMGADKPGDIKYLTTLAPCDVGVLTAIGSSHLETFKTVKRVAQEKQIILTHLKKDGMAILNIDDELVSPLIKKIDAEILTYGFNKEAIVHADGLKVIDEADGRIKLSGLNFKIVYNGALVPIVLSGIIGRQHVYAALSGAAVGVGFGLNLVEISEGLKRYNAPRSRMRILEGVKYTTLIDDSYNSSPSAALAALNTLADLRVSSGAKKFAVLGDMLELGQETESAHRAVGELVAKLSIDFLVTVGDRAKIIARAAVENGMDENKIAKFDKSESAGKFLQEKIEAEDLLLIKGSQGVRMEKIVVELLADPLRAGELVCRQDTTWKQ